MATVSTFAGNGERSLTHGVGMAASFNGPKGIAMDREGTLFVAEYGNNCIRKITGDGFVTTFGGSSFGFANGAGDQAQFRHPFGVCVNEEGVVFVADTDNHRIRRILPDGKVSTLAGSGTAGYQDGNGVVGTMFQHPHDVAIDGDGNVLVADTDNHRIRKITVDGVVTTLAGNGGGGYRDGDNTDAQFDSPASICVDSKGVVYVAELTNHCIRRITHDGKVSTVAGNREAGHQEGRRTAACFNAPTGVAVDGAGSLFVADSNNHCVRKIAVNGAVTTVVGNGKRGFRDGDGNQALFYNPRSLAIDDEGNIFVADQSNHRIRKIEGVAAPRAAAPAPISVPEQFFTFLQRSRECNQRIAQAEQNREVVLRTHADNVANAQASMLQCELKLQRAQAELARAQQQERDVPAQPRRHQ